MTMDLDLKLRPGLKVENFFGSQLFMALAGEHGESRPRVQIEWGQLRVFFARVDRGTYSEIRLYDRDDGGDLLGSAKARPATFVRQNDTVTVLIEGWDK